MNISHDIDVKVDCPQIYLFLLIPSNLQKVILNFFFLFSSKKLLLISFLGAWRFLIYPNFTLYPIFALFLGFYRCEKLLLVHAKSIDGELWLLTFLLFHQKLRLLRRDIFLLIRWWCMNCLNDFLEIRQILFHRYIHIELIILNVLLLILDTFRLLKFLHP